jgi:hypothetical protein
MVENLTGKNVLIRGVTHYYTGHLTEVVDGWLHLEKAAWVADTGRFAQALRSGDLSEVEPYPGDCWVNGAAVMDIAPWAHELPREVK